MTVNVFLRIVAYAAVPLVMAWIGNHLAVKVEEPKKRRMYRVGFALLAIVGITITTIVEVAADREHRKEVADAKKDYAILRDDNFYLRGKLDTVAGVLGSLAARPENNSDSRVIKALATLAHQQQPKNEEELRAESKARVGHLLTDGQVILDKCSRLPPNAKATEQILQPISEWEGHAYGVLAAEVKPQLMQEWDAATGAVALEDEGKIGTKCSELATKMYAIRTIMQKQFDRQP